MRHAYGLIVFTIMAAASFLSVADVPKLITYQGWLTDTAGSPVADGNYSIRFQIYDASSGGNVKWNSGARPVSVTDGLFTHILGDSIPLPNTLFANDTALWLGVTVGVNPEFTPRTRLTSFGYAHQALRADTALYALNTIGGSYLPLSGGTMTGPITNTGDPTITMGKGNFGTNNINSGTNSFVAGQDNVASGDYATVGGGIFDTASGSSSTVPGGQRNTASGLLSFAAGSRAKAIHDYSFVWGSSLLIDFASTAERQFLIHASGGVGIGTNSPMEQLDITNPNTSGNSVVRTNRTSAFAANGLTLASAGVNEWSLRQPPTSSDNLSVFNHNLSLAAMEFDLANNNIGIGTNTPLINLSIFEDNDSDVGLRIHNPNVGAAAQEKIEFGNNAGLGIFGASNGMYVYNNRPGGTLGFEINSQYRLWINNNGNVGIGTTTPVNRFDVEGGAAIGTSYSGTNAAPANGLLVQGNVAIGTTSPAGKLHVDDVEWNSTPVRIKGLPGAVVGPTLELDGTDGTAGESYSIISTNAGAGAGGGKFAVYHNGPSDDDYRLVIENNGDVGIGTTTPSSRLHLRQDINAATGLVIDNQDPGALSATALFFNSEDGSFQPQIVVFDGSHATTPAKMRFVNNLTGGNFDFLTAGLTRVIIENGGDVGIGTTTPANKLDVEGGAVIGASYSGTNAAPANGLLVEGNVGIGTSNPGFRLTVMQADTAAAGFNRQFSDGNLLIFQKNAFTVGSISVAAGLVSYNAFTGSHYGWTGENLELGELVSLTGVNQNSHDNPKSEIIYGIKRSSIANDPVCLGSYLALSESNKPYSSENPHLVMAVGNGDMWVTDESGDIKPGDYLISSSTPGHAMKDDEANYPIGHIVARAAESVDWSLVSETIDGRKHKKISVLFGNFVRSNTAELKSTISNQQKQLNEQNDRIARLEASLLRSQIDN